MMVEPARHTASSSVNGSDATMSPVYSRSFHNRCRDVSIDLPHPPGGWIQLGPPGWWPIQPDCRAAKNACAATPRTRICRAAGPDRKPGNREVAGTSIPSPTLAQQQELPAGGVGHLDDQPSIGHQQFVRHAQVAGRIVEMFQEVKHGDGGATARSEGRLRKRSAHGGNSRVPPRRVGRIQGKIEARHGTGSLDGAALGEHLQEESASAANVRDGSLGLGFAQRPLDEVHVIPAQDEAAIPLAPSGRRRTGPAHTSTRPDKAAASSSGAGFGCKRIKRQDAHSTTWKTRSVVRYSRSVAENSSRISVCPQPEQTSSEWWFSWPIRKAPAVRSGSPAAACGFAGRSISASRAGLAACAAWPESAESPVPFHAARPEPP